MKKFVIRFLLISTFCLCLAHVGIGQTAAGKTGSDPRELLIKAKEQMAAENYTAANRSFREMLDSKAVLPTEMCYFFANTLYHLKQFDNSLRFVEKYESLAGAGGEYYHENLELKKLLKKEMELAGKCNYCDSQGYVLTECHYCGGAGSTEQTCIKCLGHKEIKCKTCSGEGVVILKNHFGQRNYNTCQICEGSGIQDCSFCNGEGLIHRNCQSCIGSGRIRTDQLCSHPQARLEN